MSKFFVNDFEENGDSEDESVFSNISSLSNDKDTHGSTCGSEPLSPVLVAMDRRNRVSSTEESIKSATPSVSALKMINSKSLSSETSNTTMKVLSNKQTKKAILPESTTNTTEEMKTEGREKSGIAWDLGKLKASDDPKNLEIQKWEYEEERGSRVARANSLPLPDEIQQRPLRRHTYSADDQDNLRYGSRSTGRCKAWYTEKGFGFIKSDDNNEEYFCHFSSIMKYGFRSLEVGDLVNFELSDNPRKPGSFMCTNVSLLDK